MKEKKIEMLQGPILPNVIRYTLPIIAASLLQLLFNAADMIVVGQFCDSLYIGAVGATTSLIHMMVNFFMGLSVGVGVCVAQGAGAKDDNMMSGTVHTSLPLATIGGLLLTVIGLIFAGPLLRLMSTPDEMLPYSVLYTKIYFIGSAPCLIYNFGAAVLRALGETKKPLYYLTASGVINIMLNMIFVAGLGMTVDGVALATVVSQIVSAVLVIQALCRRRDACRLRFSKMRLNGRYLIRILTIGFPAGIQSSLFSVSNVMIQSSINSFGELAVTANAAASSVEGFVYVIIAAFNQTSMNFVGQNDGARCYDRIRQIVRSCLICVTVAVVAAGGLAVLFSRTLLGIYITDSPEALTMGGFRLLCTTLPYFLLGMHDCVAGAIRGMKCSMAPMLITIVCICGLRIGWILTIFRIPAYHTLFSIYITYPISWLVALIAQSLLFRWILKKKKRLVNEEPVAVG